MGREKRFSRGDFLKVVGAGAVASSTLSTLSGCTVSTTAKSGDGGGGWRRERAQLLQLVGLRKPQDHDPQLREGVRGGSNPGLLLRQRGVAGEAPGRRHGIRRHRPLGLHGFGHAQERHYPEAGQVQDPELRQPRRGLQGASFRPEQRLQHALPVGDHGHPLQQERVGRDKQLGRNVGHRVRGRDRDDERRQGDHGGGAQAAGLLHEQHRPGPVGRGQAVAPGAEAPLARILRLLRGQAPGPER